jgi:Zn-finger nucleic acid-binding protein
MLRPAEGDPEACSHRKCPRCTGDAPATLPSPTEDKPSELAARLLGETLLDECGSCGGVWLQAAAFEKLIKSRDEQSTFLSGGGPHLELEAYSQRPHTLERPRYLPCPDCGQLMNRKNFANTSGVIVDVCKAHGIWFDRDELGRIIQFVMKGGLDESRRRELERLEMKMREKRAEVAGLSLMSMHEAHSTDGEWDALLRLLRDFFR